MWRGISQGGVVNDAAFCVFRLALVEICPQHHACDGLQRADEGSQVRKCPLKAPNNREAAEAKHGEGSGGIHLQHPEGNGLTGGLAAPPCHQFTFLALTA